MNRFTSIARSLSATGSLCGTICYDKCAIAYYDNDPFGNCQGWGIKYFNGVIKLGKPDTLFDKIADIKEACKISKTLLFVDIKRDKYELIKDSLVFTSVSEYKSCNGSDMVMCIINTIKRIWKTK